MSLDIVTISTVVNKFWASSLRGIVNNLKFKVKIPIDFLRLELQDWRFLLDGISRYFLRNQTAIC